VGDELISSIGKGLCVLVGISKDDTDKDMDYMYVDLKVKLKLIFDALLIVRYNKLY